MFILHVLEPFASGVSAAVSAIARELPDLTHVVIHGTRNWTEDADNVKKRFPPGITFIEWKHAGREINLARDWKAFRELCAILKPYAPRGQKKENREEGEAAVVHLHSSKAGFLGRLACRVLGIKAVIYTPHCGAFLRTDIGFMKRKLYRFLEWLGGRFGGRVVGCGPSEGELYKKLGKDTTFVSNGVALNEIEISHGGTEARSSATDSQITSGINPASGRNLISFTGIASIQKDPAMWSRIAAATIAAARAEGFSFCWIGDGPEAGSLNRDCVTLTGWKSAEEVDHLLDRTAMYFSAAAWEGLPYGVLEAMAHGCALLLRNVPGNRELVAAGENGWLFDSPEEAAEHLAAMLKDKPFLAAMGKRSSEIVEQGYTLKQMGEGYKLIYAQAAGGGK